MFTFLKSIIVNILGIRVFNDTQKKLYRLEFFIFFAIALTGVFVNTFIMIGGGIRGVVEYNFFVFFVAGLASFFQAFVAKCFGVLKAYRCGIIAFILFKLSILILGENVNDYIWIAGILSGISFPSFFVSRNMMILASAEYNQDVESVYWGAAGMMNAIFTTALPLLAGILISFIGANIGYYIIGYYIVFSFGILMFLTGFVLTFFMPEPPKRNTESNLWQDAKVLLKKKSVIFSGLGEMFRGTRDVIANFIFVSLVFYVTANEAMVGTYSMVTAICKLAGFYIIARYLNLHRAKKFLLIFALVASLTPLLLLYSVELWALFVVGGASFAVFSFQNAANIICSNAIRGYVEGGFLIRELFISLGRMIGLPILLILSGGPQNVAIAIVILGAMQIFTWLMHSRVKFKEI